MKSESKIQAEIRVALSDYGTVFRINAGEFWQGKQVYSQEFKQSVLINMRRVQGAPTGFSDLLFVGNGMVAFIETKRPGEKPRKEQNRFMEQMRKMGHRVGVATSVFDALKIIGEVP